MGRRRGPWSRRQKCSRRQAPRANHVVGDWSARRKAPLRQSGASETPCHRWAVTIPTLRTYTRRPAVQTQQTDCGLRRIRSAMTKAAGRLQRKRDGGGDAPTAMAPRFELRVRSGPDRKISFQIGSSSNRPSSPSGQPTITCGGRGREVSGD